MEQEIWLPVVGYEGYYEVSSFGRVKSLSRKSSLGRDKFRITRERILRSAIGKRGYIVVTLFKNCQGATRTIHSLIAESFLNYKRCQFELVVDHVDNNRLNNFLSNLQITTNRVNTSKDRGNKYLTGVSFRSNSFTATININSTQIYLGRFNNELTAHKFYKKAVEMIDLFNGDPLKFRLKIKEYL